MALFTQEGLDRMNGDLQTASNCASSDSSCISTYHDTGCKGGTQQYQCAQIFYDKEIVNTQPKTNLPATTSTQDQISASTTSQIQMMQQEIGSLKSQHSMDVHLLIGAALIGVVLIAIILYKFLKPKPL